MTSLSARFLSLLAAPLALTGTSVAAPDATGLDFFEKKIRPVLLANCLECHSAQKGKTKGGLDMDSRQAMLTGGDSGPSLVAGDAEKSKIIEGVRWTNQDFQMPPKKKLSAAEIADLEAWVAMGAPDPREPKAVTGKGKHGIDIAEGRKFWSFRPISDPAVPKVKNAAWVKTPVDAFVLAKLDEAGFQPSPAADKRTLIRRATFDLIGLPPTPEEVDAFVSDDSPNAFEKVVERLLRSPAYGERWARHWLDVARYADSNGMDENVAYGHAWRYRDYVVNAFNNDKPFDRFAIEQLAGDLLPYATEHERIENLTATGFLALGAKVLAEPDVRKMQMDVIDEEIDTLGKAFMGMTFGCVRCHDHKFDPIPQEDYYSLAAIFRSTKSLGDDTTGAIKYWYEHSLATPEQLAAKKEFEKKVAAQRKKVTDYIAKARADLKEELHSHAAEYLAAASLLSADADYAEVKKVAATKQLRSRYLLTCQQYLSRNVEHPFFAKWQALAKAKLANEVAAHYSPLFVEAREAWKTAKTKDAKATTLKDARLDPALAALHDIAGFLAIPDKNEDAFESDWFAQVDQMNDELMTLERGMPDPDAIMGVADGTVTKTLALHVRGSYLTLGKECERGFPQVMQASLKKPILPAKQSGRLEFARWLASGEHPLTARVFVNRLWRWHFGTGIVASTDNFGTLGDKPSHPELLDWLARRFIEDGWSIKAMHRLIMNSACYQQSSGNPESGIRSPVLAENTTEVVNNLGTFKVESSAPNSELRTPSLTDPENRLLWRANVQRLEAEEIRDALLSVSGWLDPQIGGKTIPLRDKEFVFNHTSKDHTTYETPRRALYLPIIRNHLYTMLEQFDYPDPTMPTGSRNATVVSPQALLMMNSPVVMDAADKLAARLFAEVPGDDARRIARAYTLVYSRAASPEETKRMLDYVSTLQRTFGGDAANGKRRAWSLLCHTLLGANEFIYLR